MNHSMADSQLARKRGSSEGREAITPGPKRLKLRDEDNSPPTDPPSVSSPQPSPPSADVVILTMSDLGALIRLLCEVVHHTHLLSIFLGLEPGLIHGLREKALGDPFKHLSFVLETRLQHGYPFLSLKHLMEAISQPPISNEVLAWKLEQFFMSEDRQKRLERTSISLLSPAMTAYSQFLDMVYQIAAIPPDPKGGPKPSTQYTNLAVIKKEEVSQVKADAFTKATLHGGIDQIMRKKKAIELKDIFKPEEGQAKVDFVLAEGAPGVGKSTMAHELCRRRHEIEATKAFAAVVLLRLREKEVQEAKSVADLLYHDNPKVKEAVVEEICSTSGENILFILDGFDEVHYRIRKSMLVARIISGQHLPKATVLVTSRPSARADLLSLRTPDKHIEVLGFTTELIEQYASTIFGSNTPLLADFLKYVSTNPAIKSMMYIPLNCAIVVEIYQENREEGRPIPQTMTQLYSEITLSRMSRHLNERGGHLVSLPEKLEDLAQEHPKVHHQLLSLAELAFNGTLKQEVIFEKLPAGCSTLGLMTASQRLYVSRRVSTNYSFFHLSVQEFLSAYYISHLPDSEQKKAFEQYSDEYKLKSDNIDSDQVKSNSLDASKSVSDNFDSDKSELDNSDSDDSDKSEFNDIDSDKSKSDDNDSDKSESDDSDSDMAESDKSDSDESDSVKYEFTHMDVVWRFVAGLTGFGSIGWNPVRSRKGDIGYRGRVSSFFIECLYEAQQKIQCELILGQRSKLTFLSDSAFSSFACGYCVAVSRSTWKVWLQSPPETWEMFVYGLTSQEEVHGSISELELIYNPIGQEGIARLKDIPQELLQQLSVLNVDECELDGSALDQLSDVIPSMTSLKDLSISDNPAAGDGGTVKLLQTLQVAAASHLQHLCMPGIPIGHDDIMALSNLISPSGGLKQLEIGDEDMQYDCIDLLLKVVFSPSSLQTLSLFGMKINVSLISTPLKGNCNITQLSILDSTIGSREISVIAKALHTNTTLERLWIGDSDDTRNNVTIESDPSQVTAAVGDLVESLKVNRSLKGLGLWLVRPDKSLALGKEEARALIDTLQYNQTLEWLELVHCLKYFSYSPIASVHTSGKLSAMM